jgi:hypothetical protein
LPRHRIRCGAFGSHHARIFEDSPPKNFTRSVDHGQSYETHYVAGFPLGRLDAIPLQQVFQQSGPGEGYDKLIILDPSEIYTGSLYLDMSISCAIRGNGALIILDPDGTITADYQAKLDIDGCVITGGDVALGYMNSRPSNVENCTLVGNNYGVATLFSDVNIKNCIAADNNLFGIYWIAGPRPASQYNNVWGNAQLNYATLCSG